jgi:uncharacterized repeat protein (TIGR03803 family)
MDQPRADGRPRPVLGEYAMKVHISGLLAIAAFGAACLLGPADRVSASAKKLMQLGGRGGGLRSMLGAALVAATVVSPGASAQTLTTLHSFAGGSDGAIPEGGLIADAAGNLYSTTEIGGTSTFGCGTVFELTPTGTLTVLHNLAFSDGSEPTGRLIADAAGNLYGTARFGGTSSTG